MTDYEVWEIGNHILEYFDDTHTYLYDGVILPSITQVIKIKFGNKYNGIPKEIMQRASDQGTAVHEAIEQYCKYGKESALKEVRNFKFLQKQYEFTVINNEVPVVLFKDDKPISAGRLDLVLLEDGGRLGLGDIKRTSVLDKEYLAYQLNLYRIAYMQSYDESVCFLKGLHLRENTRKYVDIPINEELAWQLVNEYLEKEK